MKKYRWNVADYGRYFRTKIPQGAKPPKNPWSIQSGREPLYF